MFMRPMKCAALALATFGLIAANASARAQTPSDPVYLGLSKDVTDGRGTTKLVKIYKCNVPPGPSGKSIEMMKLMLPLTLPFSSHSPCDEDGLAGKITTTWTVLLRTGPIPTGGGFIPFGTHAGTFMYTDTAGNVIKGSMAGTVSCGTHRDPFTSFESCRENMHFEGYLAGRYVSGPIFTTYNSLGLPSPQIKASYAGNLKGVWPSPNAPSTSMTCFMAIDGVYAFPCGG